MWAEIGTLLGAALSAGWLVFQQSKTSRKVDNMDKSLTGDSPPINGDPPIYKLLTENTITTGKVLQKVDDLHGEVKNIHIRLENVEKRIEDPT